MESCQYCSIFMRPMRMAAVIPCLLLNQMEMPYLFLKNKLQSHALISSSKQCSRQRMVKWLKDKGRQTKGFKTKELLVKIAVGWTPQKKKYDAAKEGTSTAWIAQKKKNGCNRQWK
eukprot:963539_1